MKPFLLAVIVAAVIAASWGTIPPSASASTGHDADRIAWYLKGQTDALFASRGWTTLSLACHARPDKWVSCDIRVRVDRRGVFCDHALYRIHGFGINGQAAKPVRCAEAPSS